MSCPNWECDCVGCEFRRRRHFHRTKRIKRDAASIAEARIANGESVRAARGVATAWERDKLDELAATVPS